MHPVTRRRIRQTWRGSADPDGRADHGRGVDRCISHWVDLAVITDKQLDAADAAHSAHYLDPSLLRHALRMAVEAADRAAWQTVETAPRDGRQVLVYSPQSKIADAETFIDWFEADHGGWPPGLTVWRPIPAPLEAAS